MERESSKENKYRHEMNNRSRQEELLQKKRERKESCHESFSRWMETKPLKKPNLKATEVSIRLAESGIRKMKTEKYGATEKPRPSTALERVERNDLVRQSNSKPASPPQKI